MHPAIARVFNTARVGYQGVPFGGNDQFTKIYYNFDAGAPNGTGWANLAFGGSSLPNPAIAGGPGVKNDGGSPVPGGGNSMDCNVTNGYGALQSASADFDFGAPNSPTNDFSVDWWEYRPTTVGNTVSVCRDINAAYQAFAAGYIAGANGTTAQTFYASSTGPSNWDIASAVSMGAPTLNAWHHLAFGRVSNNWGTWLDGVPQGNWTSGLTPLAAPSATVALGCWNAASSAIFNGHIFYDEFRLSKGICRYAPGKAFTPYGISAPYSNMVSGGNDANAKLLLHLDGNLTDACAGATPHVFTMGGSANYNSPGKFGTNCLQVGNSTTDRITTPNSTDFDFGSGHWCIDFWAKRLSPGTGAINIIAKRALSTSMSPFLISDTGANMVFYASSAGASWDIANNLTIAPQGALNNWVHWAIVRWGTSLITFANGYIQSFFNIGPTALWANNDVLSIGGLSDGGSAPYQFDEVRITKGVPRFTENFYPLLMTQPY